MNPSDGDPAQAVPPVTLSGTPLTVGYDADGKPFRDHLAPPDLWIGSGKSSLIHDWLLAGRRTTDEVPDE